MMPEVRHYHISVTASSTSTTPTKPAPLNQQARAVIISQTNICQSGATTTATVPTSNQNVCSTGENLKQQRHSPYHHTRSPVKCVMGEERMQHVPYSNNIGCGNVAKGNRHNFDNVRSHQRLSPNKIDDLGHNMARTRKDSCKCKGCLLWEQNNIK